MLGETVRGNARGLSVCVILYLLWLGVPLEVSAAQDIDGVIASAAESGTFAGVVLVRYRDGSELFRSVGDAVREFRVPHRRDTRFKFHSLMKPLTSVAIYSAIADELVDDEVGCRCILVEGCASGL